MHHWRQEMRRNRKRRTDIPRHVATVERGGISRAAPTNFDASIFRSLAGGLAMMQQVLKRAAPVLSGTAPLAGIPLIDCPRETSMRVGFLSHATSTPFTLRWV